jgi:hypothetical protein
MSKGYIWLVQLINFILYISLQIAIVQHILPFYKPTCFVYIGFFLFLPWKRSNLILQLLLGFLVGFLVDLFYDSLGVHAFAAVLLIYLRNFLLYMLPPYAANGNEYASRPTLVNMGFKKFATYGLILLLVYHLVVLSLNSVSIALFFNALPQLILNVLLSYLLIFSLQLTLILTVGNTYTK